ncbi:hypothetical protein LMG19146_00150 [Xanthomonas arboricola pv. fragariae]|nr:hypothetical protein LMG19146_00150 [Xanthomonas arboricola pv. fragariae]
MAARPPRLVGAPGAGDRVVGRVLPGAVDRARTRGDHHVPGRRAGGAADGGGHVVPAVVAGDLGAFLRVAFHVPAFRVFPAVVDVLGRADHLEAVVGELHVIAAAQEQIALAVLAHRVAGVDVLAQADIDRRAPRTLDVVGPDHEVAALALVATARREVDVVALAVLDQVRRPDRADVLGDGMAQRLPVDQIARMPDRQARVGVERGQREVVVLPVLEYRRVGVIAGQHRVEEGAVALVGDALVFDAALPVGRGSEPGTQQQAAGQQPTQTG